MEIKEQPKEYAKYEPPVAAYGPMQSYAAYPLRYRRRRNLALPLLLLAAFIVGALMMAVVFTGFGNGHFSGNMAAISKPAMMSKGAPSRPSTLQTIPLPPDSPATLHVQLDGGDINVTAMDKLTDIEYTAVPFGKDSGQPAIEAGSERDNITIKAGVPTNLDIKVPSGTVLDINNSTGNVTYKGDLAQGESSITVDKGNITAILPLDSEFQLDAATEQGSISSDFDLGQPQREKQKTRLQGYTAKAPDGAPSLNIQTGSGDINIKKGN